jgi:hypothetical protein
MECVSSKPRNIIFDQILSFVELQYLRMQDFYSKYYLGWDDPFHFSTKIWHIGALQLSVVQ